MIGGERMAFVTLEVYISHFDAMRKGAETDGQDANQSSMFTRFRDPAGDCVVCPVLALADTVVASCWMQKHA